MQCTSCGCRHSYVANTYTRVIHWRGQRRIHKRRRRVCRNCGLPFTTVEVLENESEPGTPDTPELPATPTPEPTAANPYL
ncbi:MAG: hypothetical protein Tsb009_06580 [Planctomycetaceae bacterium]